MPDENSPSAGQQFNRLVEIMARLRAPDGCPWDREQTFDSIKPYTLEETYEVMDAIDRRDFRELCGELGDLILQAVFHARMAEEEGLFTITDSLEHINRKLIRRHPHVFGEGEASTAGEVKKRWDEIKAEEKSERGGELQGLLDGVPRILPALVEASQVSSRAAGAGFDWPNLGQVLDKVREEIGEIEHARENLTREDVEGEVGDLLFTIVNVARFLQVDPEQALRKTNAKFRERFSSVERGLAERGRSLRESKLEEMEELWQKAKKKSK
jgi:MazG family protein